MRLLEIKPLIMVVTISGIVFFFSLGTTIFPEFVASVFGVDRPAPKQANPGTPLNYCQKWIPQPYPFEKWVKGLAWASGLIFVGSFFF